MSAGRSVFIIERAAVPVVPAVKDDPTVLAVPADQTVSAVSSGTEGVPAAAEVGAEVVVNDVEVEEVLASTDAVPIAGDGGNIVGEAVQPRANDWGATPLTTGVSSSRQATPIDRLQPAPMSSETSGRRGSSREPRTRAVIVPSVIFESFTV